MTVEGRQSGAEEGAASWLRSAFLSVLLTALVVAVAIVVGGACAQYLGLTIGWSFAIAALAVAGEIWVVLTTIRGMRRG